MTLYYEPIIYSENQSDVSRHGLSLVRVGSGEYTPDYVLKFEHGNRTDYVICDAKFSPVGVTLGKHLPALVEKYQSNVHLLSENNEHIHVPLCLLYGEFSDSTHLQSMQGISTFLTSSGISTAPFCVIPLSPKMLPYSENEDPCLNSPSCEISTTLEKIDSLMA